MRTWYRRFVFSVLCLGLAASAVVMAQERRALTPDDIFKIERTLDVSISPDGQTVAVVRSRPLISAPELAREWLGGRNRGDIWLTSATGDAPINLTNGDVDGSGYWAPTWSPDGKRLVMLSTKGSDNTVRLWVWEKAVGRLTKLSERGVSSWWDPPVWVDSQHLAVVLLPDGEQSGMMTIERRSAIVAMREWSKAAAGRETTVSALESGVAVDLNTRTSEQMTLIDVTGKVEPVLSRVRDSGQHELGRRSLWVASHRQYFAFLNQIVTTGPDTANLAKLIENGRLGWWGARYQIAIADSSGRVILPSAQAAKFVVPGSFKWSHDGRSFAFIGVREGEEYGPFRVFKGTVGGSIEAVSLPDLEPHSVIWAKGDRPLVLAERVISSGVGTTKKRLDLWLVSPNRTLRNLSEHLNTTPAELLPDRTGESFVGVADSEVWRVNIDSGEWTNLTTAFEPRIAGIALPNNDISRDDGLARIMVSVAHGLLTDYYRISVASGSATLLPRPSDSARLVAYRPEVDVAVFAAHERTGTYLTLVQGEERRPLVETSRFLRDIAEGERRLIEYRSLDGQNLKGWLLLPANYQAGKRYPLVTYVNAGAIMTETAARALSGLNNPSHLNLQLLTARGYVVLFPSMPLVPGNQGGSDPLLDLTKGVLPSVDKAIELGIADPNRLAVMGHSIGGYSTFGLITQTNRFKAAVELAGLSNFLSMYGIFQPNLRYEPYPHEYLAPQWGFETSWGRMGNPPWKDWARYLRNSPIFYVDRVQTPLLLVHGDMDFVPIEQAEEFFTALYRQGKRARFLRYWGETHHISSPANIRDFWMQAYAWLDEFLDIARDAKGNPIFDGDHVKSRNGASALKPEDFARFNELELTSRNR